MEQTKQKLSSLIDVINESFPEENDLKSTVYTAKFEKNVLLKQTLKGAGEGEYLLLHGSNAFKIFKF